nr:MAG TPA: hypothetical protein [Caudoviricetes sp.]
MSLNMSSCLAFTSETYNMTTLLLMFCLHYISTSLGYG